MHIDNASDAHLVIGHARDASWAIGDAHLIIGDAGNAHWVIDDAGDAYLD